MESALPLLAADPRIVGVAAAGSLANGVMDAHSDLDFVVAVEPEHADWVMRERVAIATSLGPLLTAFPGDHVGELRLLICLYGPPLLHVDLKFVALPDAARRVDENRILFDRDGRLADVLARAEVGATPNGVRRFETLRPDLAPALAETLASHDAAACARALRASIALYRGLRDRTAPPDLVLRRDAEREAVAWFARMEGSP